VLYAMAGKQAADEERENENIQIEAIDLYVQ
jgi:hypothetical protein